MSQTPPNPGAARELAMTDVARLAGVSHQTVSRVLNGHPNVREQTRLRVRAAIEQLGYRPNRAARTLATGRSKLLGVVAQNSTLFGPSSLLAAFELAAASRGFVVSVRRVRVLDRAPELRVDPVVDDLDALGVDVGVRPQDVRPHPGGDRDDPGRGQVRRPLDPGRQPVAPTELFGFPRTVGFQRVSADDVRDVVEDAGQQASEIGIPGVGMNEVNRVRDGIDHG